MANAEHLERLRRGVHAWNDWRRQARAVRPDLRRAYLPEANLRGFDLREADLSGATLLGADASGADLRGADLSQADLRYCSLRRARLHRTVLRETKGLGEGARRAAEAPAWRERMTRLAPALALVAAGVAGWLAASHGEARSEGPPAAVREAVVVAVPAPVAADLEAALAEVRFPGWAIERVERSGGALRIRLDTPAVEDGVYLPTLAAACGALLGRPGVGVRRIEIVDREALRGWVYESPGNCEPLLRAPQEMLRLAAAADSRPYRPADETAVNAFRPAP